MDAASTFVSLSHSQAHHLSQLSDEEFWRYAAERAASFSPTQQVEDYLLCDLGKRRCILPPGLAREIVPPPHQLTLLPATPAWMPGLTVWRGEIIPLVNVWAYLWHENEHKSVISGAPPVLAQLPDLLLVVQACTCILGLLVTEVTTTMKYADEHVVPFELAPDWCSALRPQTIKGVVDDALVLDVPFIFDDIVRQIEAFSSDKGVGSHPGLKNE
jgi:chemotaxis signal transduction protein